MINFKRQKAIFIAISSLFNTNVCQLFKTCIPTINRNQFPQLASFLFQISYSLSRCHRKRCRVIDHGVL